MTMSSSYRDQATRLLTLAIEAKNKRNIGLAKLLTDAATRYLEQALAIEAAEAFKRPTHKGPVTLQQ